MESLATRLKSEREKHGLSQEELAALARVAQSTVASLEVGRSRTSTKLVKIARALKVNPDWLETGKGQRDVQADTQAAYVSADSLEDLVDKMLAKGSDEIGRFVQLAVERERRRAKKKN